MSTIMIPIRRPRAGIRPLFAWRAGMVEGWTHVRATTAAQRRLDMILESAASGRLRDGHFPLTERAVLLEDTRTNMIASSENLAAWTNSGTVLTGGQSGPDGLLNAWLVADAGLPAPQRVSHAITGTSGNGTKALTLLLKQGTAPKSTFGWFDSTAAVWRLKVDVTWNGTAPPTLTVVDGAGTLYTPVQLAGSFWALMVGAGSVTAANTNTAFLYPAGADAVSSSATVVFGGAQAENAAIPSSYFKTSGATAARAVDQLSWAYTEKPQAMTVYVRLVDAGIGLAGAASRLRILTLSNSLTTALSAFQIRGPEPGNSGFRAVLTNSGGTFVESLATGNVNMGDVVELRATVSAAGSLRLSRSVNGAAEAFGTASAAFALPAAWTNQALWLNSESAGANAGFAGYTHAYVWPGSRELAWCRMKAGVS